MVPLLEDLRKVKNNQMGAVDFIEKYHTKVTVDQIIEERFRQPQDGWLQKKKDYIVQLFQNKTRRLVFQSIGDYLFGEQILRKVLDSNMVEKPNIETSTNGVWPYYKVILELIKKVDDSPGDLKVYMALKMLVLLVRVPVRDIQPDVQMPLRVDTLSLDIKTNIPQSVRLPKQQIVEDAVQFMKEEVMGRTNVNISFDLDQNLTADEIIINVVKEFNSMSRKKYINLILGTDGSQVTSVRPTEPGKEIHSLVLLGHQLSYIVDAKKLSIPLIQKGEDVSKSAERYALISNTVVEVVDYTTAPVTITQYKPETRMGMETQYVYIGFPPKRFDYTLYALSDIPPSFKQDVTVIKSNQSNNNNNYAPGSSSRTNTDIGQVIQESRSPKKPKVTATDVGVVGAAVGVGALGLSSVAFLFRGGQ